MDLPTILLTVRHLVRDTFRQARASGVHGLMLGVSAVCILVCLSVNVSSGPALKDPNDQVYFLPRGDPRAADKEALAQAGVEVAGAEVTLAFGAFRLPVGRDARDAVHFLQLLLAGGVADAAGILLLLVWTAGFLPSFLETHAVAVLLVKPVPRWGLLLGKYVGVLTFVAFQAILFVGGTWLALGLKTGIWQGTYLLCVPILLLHFSIFFSVSVLLAVTTRSTMACVFGSLVFWFLCWGMNYGRHVVVGLPEGGALAGMFGLVEAGYWVLPKPADLGVMLFEGLDAKNYFGKILAFDAVRAKGAFWPELSVLTSLGFLVAALTLSAREFVTLDY